MLSGRCSPPAGPALRSQPSFSQRDRPAGEERRDGRCCGQGGETGGGEPSPPGHSPRAAAKRRGCCPASHAAPLPAPPGPSPPSSRGSKPTARRGARADPSGLHLLPPEVTVAGAAAVGLLPPRRGWQEPGPAGDADGSRAGLGTHLRSGGGSDGGAGAAGLGQLGPAAATAVPGGGWRRLMDPEAAGPAGERRSPYGSLREDGGRERQRGGRRERGAGGRGDGSGEPGGQAQSAGSPRFSRAGPGTPARLFPSLRGAEPRPLRADSWENPAPVGGGRPYLSAAASCCCCRCSVPTASRARRRGCMPAAGAALPAPAAACPPWPPRRCSRAGLALRERRPPAPRTHTHARERAGTLAALLSLRRSRVRPCPSRPDPDGAKAVWLLSAVGLITKW